MDSSTQRNSHLTKFYGICLTKHMQYLDIQSALKGAELPLLRNNLVAVANV